jgi:ribosome-associated translation inhibitor RaiA
MDIHFKTDGYERTIDVTSFATKKVETLSKYLGKESLTGETQVFVTLGKETKAHHTGKIWKAEINLDSEGVRYNAKSLEEHMEDAVTKAVKEMASELRKARKKKTTLLKRGGAFIKNSLREINSFRDKF